MRTYIFLFTIFLCTPSASISAPRIQTDSSEIHLGTIYAGEIKEHTFILNNKGDSPLKITRIHNSCGCAAVMINNKTVQPNEKANLLVRFNSKNFRGKIIRQITISCNDPQESNKQFTIKANIIPEVVMIPPRLILKISQKDKYITHDLSLVNQSDIPLKITSIRTTSQHIKFKKIPSMLKPGEASIIRITVNTANFETKKIKGYILLNVQGHTTNHLQIPIVIKKTEKKE